MKELYEELMLSPEEKATMQAEEQAKAEARRKKDPDQAAGEGAGFGNPTSNVGHVSTMPDSLSARAYLR